MCWIEELPIVHVLFVTDSRECFLVLHWQVFTKVRIIKNNVLVVYEGLARTAHTRKYLILRWKVFQAFY